MSQQPPSSYLLALTAPAPLRILIVEDHPMIALALRVSLEGLGQRVVGTAADRAAVRRQDLGAIDLALVDVHLADGPTGPDIAADLSEQGVPVVFHTSDPEGIPAGFTQALGVLEKPSTQTDLFQLIRFVTLPGEPRPDALRPLRRT